MKDITLTNGHTMTHEAFNAKLAYFSHTIDTLSNGGKVIKATQPWTGYDYSFLVSGISDLNKEVLTKFSQAGLKTEVRKLLPNTLLIACKY